MSSADVIMALGGAAREGDPYLANVLATEALNRHRRRAAAYAAITVGAVAFVVVRTFHGMLLAERAGFPAWIGIVVTLVLLVPAAVFALGAYWRARRRLGTLTA